MEKVSFDELGVTRTLADGRQESVRWDDLCEVVILTTDEGPMVDDVKWILRGTEGGCLVPSETAGMDVLLPRLQELPGFDNEAVIAAMGCTDDRAFLCWRRGRAE
jgi:hypothetical protein